MPRTIEDVEADIDAIKSNPKWATTNASLNAYTELLKEKNQLTQPPQAGLQLSKDELIGAIEEGNRRYDEKKQNEKERLTLTISDVTQTKFHAYLNATGFLEYVDEFQASWILNPLVHFQPYTWTAPEEADMPNAFAHLKNQMSLFGIKFEREWFQLYDVHKYKQLLSFNDPRLGKVSGGTDVILAPHGYSTKTAIHSIKANGCVYFELKSTFSTPVHPSPVKEKGRTSKSSETPPIDAVITKLSADEVAQDESKKGLTIKNCFQAELELICGFYHGNQNVLVVLTNMCSDSHAFTLNYSEEERAFNIVIYENLSLDQVGWLVSRHLTSHCFNNKKYQLPRASQSNLNESQKLVKLFKEMKVTSPELSLDYEHFTELLELTKDGSAERLQVVNQFFYSMDHSDSYLSMFA